MKNTRDRGTIVWAVVAALCVALLTESGFAITVPPDAGDDRIEFVGGAWKLQTDLNETIEIVQDNLTLDGNGYTVIGTGVGDGVWANAKTGVTVKNMNVTGFVRGVHMRDAQGNTVSGNNLYSNNLYGVYFASSMSSDGNIVENNSVTSNGSHGIYLNTYCNDNIIRDNLVDSNGAWGLMISTSCNDNHLIRNVISNNSTGGVYLYQSGGATIYNNDFLNHATQFTAYATFSNIFSMDPPIGGNNYSDWTGADVNGDGLIDDNPRTFPGGIDAHPMLVPYSGRIPMLMEGILTFYDDNVASNKIKARGRNPELLLAQFRDILEDAQENILSEAYIAACSDLDDALDACDGERRDLILGVAVEELRQMILDLEAILGC